MNCVEHLLILGSNITDCGSISGFACVVGIPLGIKSCTDGLKICVITAEIEKH